MYLLCICPSPHDYIRPGFTSNCNNPSSESHTCPACDTKQLSKFRSKTWKQTRNKVSCFASSSVQNSFHFLHSSGRFYWLTVMHAQLKHFHNCSSNHGCYLMHLRNQDQHSQTGGVHMSLSLTPLSTNSLNTKFHCAFSAMTVPISLSLSTPVPILPGKPQCFRLQSQGYQSVQTYVKLHCSCTLSNLRCSTTHVLSHKCGN